MAPQAAQRKCPGPPVRSSRHRQRRVRLDRRRLIQIYRNTAPRPRRKKSGMGRPSRRTPHDASPAGSEGAGCGLRGGRVSGPARRAYRRPAGMRYRPTSSGSRQTRPAPCARGTRPRVRRRRVKAAMRQAQNWPGKDKDRARHGRQRPGRSPAHRRKLVTGRPRHPFRRSANPAGAVQQAIMQIDPVWLTRQAGAAVVTMGKGGYQNHLG